MAFVASHAQHQSHSEFPLMDDNMEISSDAGHRNPGDDDEIDIDIDLHADRADDTANDDFMLDNSHHNPDDDLMFDETTTHDDNHAENMDQDTAGEQYEQLEDVQDQYPPHSAVPQQPPFEPARHSSSLTPKPSAFPYAPNQEPTQFYPAYEHTQHPEHHFQGHPPQFQYTPQDLAQYPPDAAAVVAQAPRPPMTNNLEPSSLGYDQAGEYSNQIAQDSSDQTNGYGLSTAAPSEPAAHETVDNRDTAKLPGQEHDDTLQAHDDSETVPGIHPVVVNWKGEHFSLFPGLDDDPYDGYFLEDTAPAFSEVNSLMDSLRQVLGEDCPQSAELRLAFPVLGLTLTQNSPSNASVTLVDIIDIYYSLCQNDGIDYPEPLEAILSTRQDPETRMAELRQALENGKGLSQVEAETWNAEESDNSFDDDSPGYPDPLTNANGDDETADELDEYKGVYEDISAVVKELKTLAPAVEVPVETSASSDNEEGEGEPTDFETVQALATSGQAKAQEQKQDQSYERQDQEDLLDDTVDEEPAGKAEAIKSAKSQSESVLGSQQSLSVVDAQQPDEKEKPELAEQGAEEAVATHNDSLSNLGAVEDPNAETETSHEATFAEEDYLETGGHPRIDSGISNEPPQEALDLLDETEDPPLEPNEADDLLDDNDDEAGLDDQDDFDTALGATDLATDQIDDLEDSNDFDASASAGGEISGAIDITEPSSNDAASLSNKRPRDEFGSDELEIGTEANDAKKLRSG